MTITAQSGLQSVAAAFGCARAARRGAFIPYLCAGDPDLATTEALLVALGEAGADLIEFGIPYSDPLADGPTIAAAAQRALDAGTTIEAALQCAARARRRGAPPLIAFTYLNPVLQYGVERFADALFSADACGAIVPDVTFEEGGRLRTAFQARSLALPLLIAPTTPPQRAAAIAARSSGFTYLVSRMGVTGARHEPDFSWLAQRAAALRTSSDVPIAIGFGISTPEHVRRTCAIADGAIVGSALIDAYAGTRGDEAVGRTRALAAELAAATSATSP
ncbi:MAG: tryptophan synthase subunit alpha [Candidatus Eremiobacteraeota bacterium]|nr:tryptophan synthase subunit alpha [Candidatus Eremiobacteraeota bacterium]